MKIKQFKRKTKKINNFLKKEWGKADIEFYGRELEENYWDKKKFYFIAEDNGEIFGVLKGHYMAGVMHISEFIIEESRRGTGIGKKMMEKAENLAKEQKIHLINLKTGIGWKAVKFYKTLGYRIEGKMKKYYAKTDFYIMVKYLSEDKKKKKEKKDRT